MKRPHHLLENKIILTIDIVKNAWRIDQLILMTEHNEKLTNWIPGKVAPSIVWREFSNFYFIFLSF